MELCREKTQLVLVIRASVLDCAADTDCDSVAQSRPTARREQHCASCVVQDVCENGLSPFSVSAVMKGVRVCVCVYMCVRCVCARASHLVLNVLLLDDERQRRCLRQVDAAR